MLGGCHHRRRRKEQKSKETLHECWPDPLSEVENEIENQFQLRMITRGTEAHLTKRRTVENRRRTGANFTRRCSRCVLLGGGAIAHAELRAEVLAEQIDRLNVG